MWLDKSTSQRNQEHPSYTILYHFPLPQTPKIIQVKTTQTQDALFFADILPLSFALELSVEILPIWWNYYLKNSAAENFWQICKAHAPL